MSDETVILIQLAAGSMAVIFLVYLLAVGIVYLVKRAIGG